jgi:uncharacterized protein YgiM (DUF1202 family)
MNPITQKIKISLMIGLITLGSILLSSLPTLARPAILQRRTEVRSNTSFNSNVLETFAPGPVEVLKVAKDDEGQDWYYIRTPAEGSEDGWVRSDQVTLPHPRNQSYAVLGGDRGEPGDRINIRSVPRMDGEILHYGLTGDVVRMNGSKSNDGYLWRHVTFPNGASGWVRYDLISSEWFDGMSSPLK